MYILIEYPAIWVLIDAERYTEYASVERLDSDA